MDVHGTMERGTCFTVFMRVVFLVSKTDFGCHEVVLGLVLWSGLWPRKAGTIEQPTQKTKQIISS